MIPQHVEGQILFDGIYFDTFGEFYEDLRYSLLLNKQVLIQDNINNSQSYQIYEGNFTRQFPTF